MTYSVHITTAAERDVANATDYIDQVLKNPKAADELLEAFTNRSMTWLFSLPAIRWQEMRYWRPGEFASCASRIISPFI